MIAWDILEQQLEIFFGVGKYGLNSTDEGLMRIVDAYDLIVRSGTTMFGQLPISPNKPVLMEAFRTVGRMNISQSVTSLGLPPHQVLAQGFFGYWTGCPFMPLPPSPPAVIPAPLPTPNICTFGGDVTTLAANLKYALEDVHPTKTAKSTAQLVTMALRLHAATIVGMYFGILLTPLGPVPLPPIPWVGVF